MNTPRKNLMDNALPAPTLQLWSGDRCEKDYGGLDRMLGVIQRLFDAISNSSAAISLWIEQRRARIETRVELARWNRERDQDHERD